MGFVMCDGNEKVGRRICGAPKQYLRLMPNMPKTITSCPNSPVFAGMHQRGSKYCTDHAYLDRATPKRPHILVKINLRDQAVSSPYRQSD